MFQVEQLSDLAAHYRRLCPSIKEICFLPGMCAVAVPDFVHLRRRQIVNSAVAIRFEMDAAAQQLPPAYRAYQLVVRSSPLPRRDGKIDETLVAREVLGHEPIRNSWEPQTPSERKLVEVIRQFKPGVQIAPEMNLELDLGFDSLQRIELIFAIEKAFRFETPIDVLADFLTMGDLARYLEKLDSRDLDAVVTRASWRDILNAPLTAEELHQARVVLAPKPVVRAIAFPFLCLIVYIARILFRVRAVTTAELPSSGPFAFCVNHASHLDPLFLACALPLRLIRRLWFLGFSDYFASGRFTWLWRMLRVVPIDPDRYARLGLRVTMQGLRGNLIACVFPEGSRSADGQLQPFQGGLFIVARELALPVVPVAIVGSYEVWPRISNRIRIRPVQVRLGKAVTRAGDEKLDARLYAAVKELLEQLKSPHSH
jgi:long-chain acyl-CoA synthetase